ncbi:ATP-binding protein [Alkalihalobacillus sp. BA299]|uniref:ATP-binding protein n=1 Tax=Alkalihalobacillus sp. BA299 TaxID=2815938 RepID=UPI001AD9B43D|nr:ATP-binding protein [Alkalihalobacillus sp. BA299]
MRRFLEKVFKGSTTDYQSDFPSLPSDLTFSECDLRTKRGYLARKISQYLDLNVEEGDKLFYQSLRTFSLLNSNTNQSNELILQLSEQLLEWHEQKQDIPQKIKGLAVRNDIQNAMLKAYDMHKQDIFSNSLPQLNQEDVVSFAQEDNSEWEVYRDVIFAATQGQFLLISQDEIKDYQIGNVICEGTIKERSDIPIRRNEAKESLERLGISKAKSMSWLLVLSEAITNTIKHAEEGKMTVVEDLKKSEIRFVIEDKGPGFPLKDLPKTTLLAGYSSKKSLGQGFTLMMKMAKQVLLYTSSSGSILILSFDLNKEGGNNNE